MSAEKIVKLEKPEEKKKAAPKVKISPIEPKDVVDILRLFQANRAEYPHAYREIENISAQELASAIFHFITAPNFLGYAVRSGRRLVAYALGQEQFRPLGNKRFLFMWSFYVDPEFRGQDVCRSMFLEIFRDARARGISSFESNSDAKTAEFISTMTKRKSTILYHRISYEF